MATRRIRKKPLDELDLATLTDFVLTPQDRTDFHRGIRLFNQARFWEAHEAWEAVWLRHPEDGRYFVQGLIQVAAGYHQLRRKIYRGFLIHLHRAQAPWKGAFFWRVRIPPNNCRSGW